MSKAIAVSLFVLATAVTGSASAQTPAPAPSPSPEFTISTYVEVPPSKRTALARQPVPGICPSGQSFMATRLDASASSGGAMDAFQSFGPLGRWAIRMNLQQSLPNGYYGTNMRVMGFGFGGTASGTLPGGQRANGGDSLDFLIQIPEPVTFGVRFDMHVTGYCAVPKTVPARATIASTT
jgi:hypothetical protein